MPESWGVFVLLLVIIGIVFAVFWMYRREIDTCPMPIKLLMAGLRLATLLFFVALLHPGSIQRLGKRMDGGAEAWMCIHASALHFRPTVLHVPMFRFASEKATQMASGLSREKMAT